MRRGWRPRRRYRRRSLSIPSARSHGAQAAGGRPWPSWYEHPFTRRGGLEARLSRRWYPPGGLLHTCSLSAPPAAPACRLPRVTSSPLRLSRRLPWEQPLNRLTRAVEERSARGLPTIDLTETNPTRVGIPYPEDELAELLRRGAGSEYRPHPRGIPEAREALAASLSRPGDPVTADDLVLTASTSESYSLLFKLFADPGDEVLTAAPSYPLLDSLAPLDSLVLRHVPLSPEQRFAHDPEAFGLALSPRTRLLAVIHPGNPLGRFLTAEEQEAIAALCAARDLPLVSDEVFADYSLADPDP